MSRPAVSVNFHHLVDLLGGDPDSARALLGGRFGFSPGTLEAVDRLRQVTLSRDHLVAVGSPAGALLQSFLAQSALTHRDSFLDGNGVLQPAFGAADASILGGFEDWAAAERKGAQSPVPDVDVFDIPDRVEVALFGDWGTGTRGADRVAESVNQAGGAVRVHLGDVYYSGTAEETTGYLLNRWPGNGALVGRACNSNHEMYSGGHSYRELTLPMLSQRSPVFVLRNAHWLLVGLDTGTTDARLSSAQVRSLTAIVESSAARNVVLMSHHPWFSWVSGVNRDLRADVQPLLHTGRVRAWYSAHDHGFVRFDREPEFGVHLSCAGHGGFPYDNVPSDGVATQRSGDFRLEGVSHIAGNPAAQGLFGPSDLGYPPEQYGPMGWLSLTIEGPELVEHVVDLDGRRHFPNVVHGAER